MVNFYPNPVLYMPFSRSLRSCEKGEGDGFCIFGRLRRPKMQKNIFFGDFLLCDMHNLFLPVYDLHVT